MAVKKGILDNFLKPSSHYSDNQKNFRSIFIDKNEDDYKPDPQNFLEASVLHGTENGTQQEHIRNTIGTQSIPIPLHFTEENSTLNALEKKQEHNWNTIGTQNEEYDHSQFVDNIEINKLLGTQIEHSRDTIGTHKEHIRNTNRTQQGYNKQIKNTIGTQQEHGKGHKYEHNKNTIGTHKEHNSNTLYTLSYLTGIQKQLVTLFFLSCKKTRSRTTEEFSLMNIANTLKIKLGSIKTSLRRLEEKQFIKAMQFKKGRGGWTKFEIPDNVYRELLESDKEHNWNTIGTQQEHISNTYRDTEKNTSSPSSSSSNILNKTTTTTQLSEEWNFDIALYARFGFTMVQLKQLAALGIPAIDVEQSLIEFTYDFDNNSLPQIKTSKLNFLMGLLRGGHTYVSETYRSEQEVMIAEMARRGEERRKKLLEEKFGAWEINLSDEERKVIESKLPTHLVVRHRAHGLGDLEVRDWLFNYFLAFAK